MAIDLTSKQVLKNVLRKNAIRPSKKMGQNFLVSAGVLKKLIEAAKLHPEDIVLEVGPGLGTLTLALAKRVKRVIAVEKDKKMVSILKKNLENERVKNIDIIEGDILKNFQYQHQASAVCQFGKHRKFDEIFGQPGHGAGNFQRYKVVANLPYNIATAVIRKFLEAEHQPELMVVMVQKEVGQRICSQPPRMQKLGVFCQFYGKPEMVAVVSKQCFWPQPKMDSAVLKIIPLPLSQRVNKLMESYQFVNLFSKIVNIGFSHPRKQLVNNFSRGLELSRLLVEKWLAKNSIKPTQRAETLTVDNWLSLARTLK